MDSTACLEVQFNFTTLPRRKNPCSPGIGYWGGYLDSIPYVDCAAYLEEFIMDFKIGCVDRYAISMQDEPGCPGWPTENYESRSRTTLHMDAWMASLTGGRNPSHKDQTHDARITQFKLQQVRSNFCRS